VTFYMWVGKPTWLTTVSTRMSWVLGGPGQKLTPTEICKKFSTQPTQTRGGSGWLAGSNPFDRSSSEWRSRRVNPKKTEPR